MIGFNYKGNSTETIIQDCRLILASWDAVTEVTGSERSTVGGERTITRTAVNEFGTIYNKLTFSYALIREDGQPISDSDQRVIETWLTSPKYSIPLELIDCNGNTLCWYDGKFIKTSWISTHGGWASVQFEFEPSTPYAYFPRTLTFTSTGNHTFTCHSDEKEEYTYPVVNILAESANTVKIKSVTDNNNTMTVQALTGLNIRIDCEKCILSDDTTHGVIDFSDIGWDDIGNIYWLRLLPGENTINITGSATVTISYKYVFKKLGGWLS